MMIITNVTATYDKPSHFVIKEKRIKGMNSLVSRRLGIAAQLNCWFQLASEGLARYARFLQMRRIELKSSIRLKKASHALPLFPESLALILAFIHFSLSRCRSTSLPEWGL